MKKAVAILLALILALSICACGSEPAVTDTNANANTDTAQDAAQPDATPAPVEENEPEEEIPVAQAIDFENENTIDETAKISFVTAFSTDELEPPMVAGVHMTYSPADGKVFVVLSTEFTNLTTSAAKVNELLTVAIAPEGSESYTSASYYGITDGGSKLDSRPSVDPLATQKMYFVFAVSKGTEGSTFNLLINDKDGCVYTGTFSIADFESAKPEVKIGDTLTDDTIELTIEDVFYTNALYPPKMSGYYHYYEAESGKTYLVVKVSAKNLKGNDMSFDSIAGVSCVYNEKYNYTSFCVLEKDGGSDLNGYPSQYAISPLDTGVCYYLMEVPEEVQNGPTVVSIYATGQYYTCTVE